MGGVRLGVKRIGDHESTLGIGLAKGDGVAAVFGHKRGHERPVPPHVGAPNLVGHGKLLHQQRLRIGQSAHPDETGQRILLAPGVVVRVVLQQVGGVGGLIAVDGRAR